MKEQKCQHINHINQKCYGENIYSKVTNDKRLALLDMVKLKGKSLKEAANSLNINYSTAKTILRVFRIENRILKKPYEKRQRKLFRIDNNGGDSENEKMEENEVVSSLCSPCSNMSVRNSSDERRNSHEVNTVSNYSGNNFHPTTTNDSDSMSYNSEELQKTTEEFLLQFKSIYANLQFCMKEVVRNEITIKNLCSVLGNCNYPFPMMTNQSNGGIHSPVPLIYSDTKFNTANK